MVHARLTQFKSLAYFYIRSLIHRPLVCHGTGNTGSASTIVLAAAAKHVLQILSLLDERRMNYTFPLCKAELLLASGFSILWQCIDLDAESKIVKDNQKVLSIVLDMLVRESQSAGIEFQRIASQFVSSGGRRLASKPIDNNAGGLRPTTAMPAPADTKSKSTRKQIQAIASRLSSFNNKDKNEETHRRATEPCASLYPSKNPDQRTYSTLSLSSTRSAPIIPMYTPPARIVPTRTVDLPAGVNLDYFAIGEEDPTVNLQVKKSPTPALPLRSPSCHQPESASWDQLVNSFDSTSTAVIPNFYGKRGTQDSGTSHDWAQEMWPMSAIDISLSSKGPVPQSVLSFSDESQTSCDGELVFSTSGSTAPTESTDSSETFKGIAIPVHDDDDDVFDLIPASFDNLKF